MLDWLNRNKPRSKEAVSIILMIHCSVAGDGWEKWISLRAMKDLEREDVWVCGEGGFDSNGLVWASDLDSGVRISERASENV